MGYIILGIIGVFALFFIKKTNKEICGVCGGEADENGDCVDCGNECYPKE